MNSPADTHVQSAEQLRYASWLERGTRVGLGVLIAAFAAYMVGWLPALVPPDQLPAIWGQPVGRYLAATGAPTGWSWLSHLGRGDMLSLAGIVILASCSLPSLLVLAAMYRRQGDKAFAAMCVAEVLVIVLAASGLLAGGH